MLKPSQTAVFFPIKTIGNEGYFECYFANQRSHEVARRSTDIRRRQRSTVKFGGTLKPAIGVVRIIDIQRFSSAEISNADGLTAGQPSRQHFLDELNQRRGPMLKFTLAFAGKDPRIALREDDELATDPIDAI